MSCVGSTEMQMSENSRCGAMYASKSGLRASIDAWIDSSEWPRSSMSLDLPRELDVVRDVEVER